MPRVAPHLALLALTLACTRELSVPARNPLTIAPETASVSPREQLVLQARGGAGSYRFRFAAGSPGSGPLATVDAETGAYRAGALGDCDDVVEVVDAAGQVAAAHLAVGTALALSPTTASVPASGLVTFTASGGLPPYTYGFAPRGNRSGGAVDAMTGDYVAGTNAGALDLVIVTDAAGAEATLASPIRVGGPRVAVPGGAGALVAGDVNGDGRVDLAYLEPAGGAARRLTVAEFPRGSPPIVETYWLPATASGVSLWDLDGSGRADLLVAGAQVELLLGTASGGLVPGPSLGAYLPADGVLAAGPYYASDPTTSSCRATRVAWGLTGPSPSCAWSPMSPVGPPVSLASGDLSGEGDPDAVFVDGEEQGVPSTPSFRFSFDVGLVTSQVNAVAPPAGTSVVLGNDGVPRHQLAMGRFSTTTRDTLAALLTRSDRNVIRFTNPWTSGAPTWAALEVDPFPSTAHPAVGIGPCPAPPSGRQGLLAWNGTGRLASLQFDAATLVTTARVDAATYPISAALCADVNGDGVPDAAVASEAADVADVLLGDGDGGFGRRPRFAVGNAAAAGDLDGDGFGDLVTVTATPGLRALLGGDHQLALGPESRSGGAVDLLATGDFSGTHGAGWTGDVVFQTPLGEQFLALGRGDGSFARPDPLPVSTGALSDPALPQALVAADLGGTAPGLDVLGWQILPTPPWSQWNRYPNGAIQLLGLVRDAGGTRRVSHRLSGYQKAVQPLDRDGDGIPDAIAVVASINAPSGVLGISSPTSIGVWTAGAAGFDPVAPGTLISRWDDYQAVGAFGDAAVFLSGANFLVVNATSYRFIARPVASFTSATFARLLPTGDPQLVVTDGSGLVRLFDTVVDGQGRLTGFTAAGTVAAPGTLAGVAPQGPGLPADVLLRAGDDVLPLVRDGPGGTLH